MPGYYGVKLGRHWNGLKFEIWDLQDLHSNAVYLVLKGEIIFILKIIKTYRDMGWSVCQAAAKEGNLNRGTFLHKSVKRSMYHCV